MIKMNEKKDKMKKQLVLRKKKMKQMNLKKKMKQKEKGGKSVLPKGRSFTANSGT